MRKPGFGKEETLESVMRRIARKGPSAPKLSITKKLTNLLCAGNATRTTHPCSRHENPANWSEADNIGRLSDWIKIYRNHLEYLGDEHDITLEHVQNISKMELAEEGLGRKISECCEETPELGGFTELDGAVRRQLEKEYGRIGRELERREQILDEEIYRSDYTLAGEGQKDNLELLLAATYELTRMRKMIGGDEEKLVALKENLERKLRQCNYNIMSKEKRQGKTQDASPVPESEESPLKDVLKHKDKDETTARLRLPDYGIIVKNAVKHLASLGCQLEDDVLGVEGIREAYAARDSYYVSLSLIGVPTPVAEIEQVFSKIYNRDRKRIEVFAQRHANELASPEILRKARQYRRVLDTWENLGC